MRWLTALSIVASFGCPQDVGIPPPGSMGPNGTTGEADLCGDGIDGNGDGSVDEGCACTPGGVLPCFVGTVLARGVGACRDGTQACVPDAGGEFGVLGECLGSVLPSAESCNGVDDDCDGVVDQGCPGGPAATPQCPTAAEGYVKFCPPMGASTCDVVCRSQPDARCQEGSAYNATIGVTTTCECSCADAFACFDGVDNDADGQVDCDAVGCWVQEGCGLPGDDPGGGAGDPGGGDSCTFALDQVCDEPEYCQPGTDTTDCAYDS